MGKAVSLYKPHYVFHLGDGLKDMETLIRTYPDTVFTGIRGNNDFVGNYPESMEIEIEGFKFFLCHGHTMRVKQGTEKFLERAKSKGADVALFGHTHIAEYWMEGSMHVLNPGSASPIMSGGNPTAGLLTVFGKDIFVKIIRI
jgi:putative phosphoesterase